jgi:hypothetical protein
MGRLSYIEKQKIMRRRRARIFQEISTPPVAPSPSEALVSVPAEIMLNVGDDVGEDVLINQYGSFTTK